MEQKSLFSSAGLMQTKVFSRKDGSYIGFVKDLMINIQTAGVEYVVFVLDVNTTDKDLLHAVPIEKFRPQDGTDNLVLDFDVEKLKDAPRFAEGDRPVKPDKVFREGVYTYFGMPNK
jgi:sporulation protein YlmC with PRC-barrel domain